MDCDTSFVAQFISVMNRFSAYQTRKDCWRWACNSDGLYTTKLAYGLLIEKKHATISQVFLDDIAKGVWNKIAPLKVSTMAWRLLWDRLPTKDNFSRRDIIIPMAKRAC